MAEKRIISKTKKITLPLIPLRGLVVFPYMILHFDIARRKSIASLEKAMLENKQVFLVAQKNIETEQPTFEELHSFGVVANVKQLLKLPNGNIHVLVEGVNRGKLIQFEKNEKYITALVRTYQEPEIDVDDLEVSALVRKIKNQFDDFAQLNTKISKESAIAVLNINEPGELSDIIASNVLTEIDDKIEILSETKPLSRIKKLISIMEREIEIAEIENDISNKVKEELEKNQKEYYLKEQLKAIQEELDGGFGDKQELEKFEQQLDALPIPEVSKNKLKTDVKRLSRLQPMSPDSSVLRTYIETVLSLPWDKSTKESINLKKVKSILDKDHYGLDKVKERIIEFLAVKQLRGDIKGNIICLVGPPGVGKTSVAKSIATAIGRNYVRLSLGGVKDESEIRGHRKTYVGSMPGKIISALIQAESNNPLILLDEVDKLSSSYNGDPAAALLEVLDSEQNYSFKDHYIEVPFDLSKVMFIVTANTLDTISKPLLDRMEIIELSSYTENEKKEICKKFLIPKQREAHGLKANQPKINDSAVKNIINSYTREAGVRQLEREVATVCRKTARGIIEDKFKSANVTLNNMEEFLGRPKYFYDSIYDYNEIGVVNGLAWTSVGGDTLKVEVNIMPGTGQVQLTGKLGDVMKESAMSAISYLRANSDKYGILPNFYKNNDIHIHVPEGATPKDGPSAGITMATALLSALKQTPVMNNIAMTGEITIRGRVLPIGGLKEKSIAAYRAGVQKIILPVKNKPDLQDIPKEVTDNIKFVFVEHIDQVFKEVFPVNKEKVNYTYRNINPEIIEDVVKQ